MQNDDTYTIYVDVFTINGLAQYLNKCAINVPKDKYPFTAAGELVEETAKKEGIPSLFLQYNVYVYLGGSFLKLGI